MQTTRHPAKGREMARYAGTIPIIVESALPYAMAGIAFAISFGIGSQISILFMSLYVMFTVSLVLMLDFSCTSLWLTGGTGSAYLLR